MPWNSQNVTSLLIVNAAAGGFSGLFVYSPAAGAGNLIASIAASAGTDPYGNAYQAGITSYGAAGNSANLNGGILSFGNGTLIDGLIASNALLLSGTQGTNFITTPLPFTTLNAIQPGTTATTEPWHAPSLGSGWATGSATAGFQPVRYRFTIDGLVEIQGILHSTSATPAATLWTFPAGWFSPTNAQRLPIVINNNAGSALAGILSISTAGAVTIPLPAISAASEDVMISARFPPS